MFKHLFFLSLLFIFINDMAAQSPPTIYDFHVKDPSGKDVSLAQYQGKVLLIINTASQCGFTPQLTDMKAVYDEFKNEGFEVLAFPSNDFGNQEPLEGEAIQQFCMLKYEAAYPIFDKIHVKGKDAHPLYKFLSDKSQNGVVSSIPKWNFHKYLIDKNGKIVDYYYSITKPNAEKVKKAIKKLLND
jgi:glutathione peroxidase